MLLYYGTFPIKISSPSNLIRRGTEDIFEKAVVEINAQKIIEATNNSYVIYISSRPLGTYGKVNSLEIKQLTPESLTAG